MNCYSKIIIALLIDILIVFNLGADFNPFAKHFIFSAFHLYFGATIIIFLLYYILSLFFQKIHNYYLLSLIIFIIIKEYIALFLYGASIL